MRQTLDQIESIFNEAFNSMPHEFSSKVFAKKTRELGLPKTSYVKNMRTDYLKKKSIRVNRFEYRKGGFVHTIKWKVNNTRENKEFYDAIRFSLPVNSQKTKSERKVLAIAGTIKMFTKEELKMLADQLGWKIQVKVETWNEI
jgi:hypothetical protein